MCITRRTLTSSLVTGEFAQVWERPAKAMRLHTTCLPLRSQPSDDKAERVGGEHSSEFILGPSSLKIPPPSCLITLPFDLNESRGPAARPTLGPLSFKGEGRGDGFLPLEGQM